MSDLRRPTIRVRCPKCGGHKGIYGRSDRNYPATLPCPRCDATGEVDQDSLIEGEEKL
jgi:ribosomal protein S27E